MFHGVRHRLRHTVRRTGRLKARCCFGRRELGHPTADQRYSVFGPFRHRRSRMPQSFDDPLPVTRPADIDRQMAVFCGVQWMPERLPVILPATVQRRGCNLVQHRQLCVHERHIDPLTLTGQFTVVQSRQDPGKAGQPGRHVRHRDARSERRLGPHRLLLHPQPTGLGVRGRPVRTSMSKRPVLPKPGYRREHQPRVVVLQIVISKAEPIHHTRREVLDHHVRPCDKFTRDGYPV